MSSFLNVESINEWIWANFNHPVHFGAEVLLVLFIIYLLTKKSYRDPPSEDKLTKTEEEELIAEWKPEPLVVAPSNEPAFSIPVIDAGTNAHVTVDGKDYINLISCGVLGLQCHPEVKKTAIETCKVFGVGSCGPRGFYGSLKPHNDFEINVAKFMGTQGGVLYGSEFQAIATVLPAFLKQGDIAIVDRGVSFAIHNGLNLCRCTKIWFNHNDMDDLTFKLKELQPEFKLGKSRVFFIGEGLYANTGDLIPLNEIMALKARYPFRMILDESYSIGVLGKTGRGITQHFGIEATQVEVIVASLGNAIGGVGGFSVCEELLASHQRLNCTGYVFSCALPPFSSAAASKSLELINVEMMARLRDNVAIAYKLLKASKEFVVLSHAVSPYIRIALKEDNGDRKVVVKILKAIQNKCFLSGVLVSAFEYEREPFPGVPCLRLSISMNLTPQDITKAVAILGTAAQECAF